MLTWAKNQLSFIGCDADYASADIVVFGAPFDATTSYRSGTRDASRVMRGESFSIETYSPYQNKDLEDYAVFDGGDLDLPFGNPSVALDRIQKTISSVFADQKRPLMIGGEHLVTLAGVRAAVERYPDLKVIQFDAHADLRDCYMGEKLSHATVMRRCTEILQPDSLFQFGIRSGDRSEWTWGQEHVWCCPFNFNRLDDILPLLAGKPVYLTIDLDVLDPSAFPGTGTPEAGGVNFDQLLQALIKTFQLSVVACDLTELAPGLDPSGIATAAALKVLRELILAWSNEKLHDDL